MRPWLLLLLLILIPAVIVLVLVASAIRRDAASLPPARPTTFHAESMFDPSPVIVTTSSTTSTSSTTTTTRPRARTAPTERVANDNVWDRLADCESGSWDAHRNATPHSADWASTSDGYEGGVHFTNGTWRGAGGGEFASHANLASRENQIVVAKRVLRRQGVRAWPVCGPKVGLTMADAA